MPRIRVLYFASLRDQVGRDADDLDVPDGTTLEAVRALVVPAAASGLPITFARNESHARPEELVGDGDEIALLPPVGGG